MYDSLFIRSRIKDRDTGSVFNHDGWKDYLDAAISDFQNIIDYIYRITRFTNPMEYPKEPFRFNYIWDTKFAASVVWANDGYVNFDLPLGLLLGVDDLCSRLASNQDFFAFDPLDNGKNKWGGGDCIWYIPFGGIVPKVRFLDYKPIAVMPSEHIARPTGTYLSNYYESFPLDPEREKLYRYMVLLAITWIFLHEEGHYAGGHLHSLKGTQESRLSTYENLYNPFENEMLFKALEWEADRSATEGLLDIFLDEHFHEYLPKYAEPKFRWNARLILSVIGAVIQMIQKTRILNSSEDSYPSPRTRLISSTFHFHKRFMKYFNNFSLTADDLLFIYCSSYDDIHVISDLINRQGQIDQWNYENPPVAEKLMHQHLFDTPEEAKLASSLFMKSYLDSEITKSISENESIIYSKWFDESRIIGQYHKDVVWPGFSEYRKMTGLPND